MNDNFGLDDEPRYRKAEGRDWLVLIAVVVALACAAGWAADHNQHDDPTGICNRPSADMGC